MNIEEYNYDLPEKFIAQVPLKNRSDSKLLLLDKENGNIKEEIFKNIKNNNIYKTDLYEKASLISKTIDISSPSKILNNIIKEFKIYERILTLTDVNKILIRIDNLIDLASTLENIGYNVYDFSDYLKDSRNKKIEIKYNLYFEIMSNKMKK